MSAWAIIRFTTGEYGVMHDTPHGALYYTGGVATTDSAKAKRLTRAEAVTRAGILNGKMAVGMSLQTFWASTNHVPMTEAMREALKLILVDGRTWKHAAERCKLTQSGIKRAMDRVRKLNDH